MPLRLTLTSADALSVALATIRPALRVLPPGTEAVLDGGRFVIEGSVPGQVEAVVSHEPALGDTQPPLSVADETQPEPVEALVQRVVEEAPQPDPMETAAELADAFVDLAPEIEPEAFAVAVAELVETVAEPPRVGSAGNPHHTPWTPEEDAKVAAMWNDGASARKIGEAMDRSEGAVVQRLVLIRERGVHLIPHGPGGSSGEGGQSYTPEEDATILAGRRAGRTFVEIGAEIGRSPDACRQRHGKLSGPEEAPAPRRNALVPGEAEEIARLASEGLTAAGVAERMGLTNRVVALSLSQSRKRAEAAQLRALVEAERAKAAAVAPSTEPAPSVDETAIPPTQPESPPAPEAPEPPAPLEPEPEPLPAIRVMRGVPFRQPAPSPLAAVTEAIQEIRRSDKPVLGRLPAIEPPRSTKPGTSDLRRKITAHLDRVGHEGGWTPLRDLDLVEGVCASRLPDTARRLEVSPEAAASRFKLLCEPIRHPTKGNDPQGQIVLAELLRERAAVAQPMAAE